MKLRPGILSGTLTLMSRLDEDFDIRLSEHELAELNKVQDIIEILLRHNKITAQ